jgi:hypothetical protein
VGERGISLRALKSSSEVKGSTIEVDPKCGKEEWLETLLRRRIEDRDLFVALGEAVGLASKGLLLPILRGLPGTLGGVAILSVLNTSGTVNDGSPSSSIRGAIFEYPRSSISLSSKPAVISDRNMGT